MGDGRGRPRSEDLSRPPWGNLAGALSQPCSPRPWGRDGAPLPPRDPQGQAGWGGSLASRPPPPARPCPCPETWPALAERPKLPEPKIAPDAGRSGAGERKDVPGPITSRRRHVPPGEARHRSASTRQDGTPQGLRPRLRWESVSGPRCCRLGLSSAPFRASVSPRSQWQARGPLRRRLPLGYFRAGCSACTSFSVPLPRAG